MAGSLTPERTGRVLDSRGAPVAGAFIVIVGGSVPVPEIALVSDEQGLFRLRLPEGEFQIEARSPAGAGRTSTGDDSDGDIVIVVGG